MKKTLVLSNRDFRLALLGSIAMGALFSGCAMDLPPPVSSLTLDKKSGSWDDIQGGMVFPTYIGGFSRWTAKQERSSGAGLLVRYRFTQKMGPGWKEYINAAILTQPRNMGNFGGVFGKGLAQEKAQIKAFFPGARFVKEEPFLLKDSRSLNQGVKLTFSFGKPTWRERSNAEVILYERTNLIVQYIFTFNQDPYNEVQPEILEFIKNFGDAQPAGSS